MPDLQDDDTTPFELLQWIRAGMLFELQDWINEGRPLRPCGKKGSAIVEAARTGFHSMVVVLLQAAEWPISELARAANDAAIHGCVSVVDRLLDCPGVAQHMTACALRYCINYVVWKKAITRGLPLDGVDGVGYVLGQVCARPLLRVFKELRCEYPDLDKAGRYALDIAAEQGSARKIALLVWAGFDPLQPYEEVLDESDHECALVFAPAVMKAIEADRVDLLMLMKLNPTPKQWWYLLMDGLGCATVGTLKFVLDLNKDAKRIIAEETSAHGALLIAVIRRLWFPIPSPNTKSASMEQDVKQCLSVLLDFGARLDATDWKTLRDIRQVLYRTLDQTVSEVVETFARNTVPAHTAGLVALVDKPKISSIVKSLNPKLYARLFPPPPQVFKGVHRPRKAKAKHLV